MKAVLFSALIWLGAMALLLADPVMTFDDLSGSPGQVPPGYHQLGWTNMYYLDGVNYIFNPSGFQAGVVSSNDVVYNNGATASIGGEMFDFLSAYVTSAFNDNEQLEAKGYIQGTLVYDKTVVLSATTATLVLFDFYGVDEVDLTPSGGTHHTGYAASGTYFAMDNVSVRTYLPYESRPLVSNGGFETGDFSGWFHSGDTNATWVTNTPAYVRSGTYGLQIGPITGPGTLSRFIQPTDIGRSYTVSFWLENFATITPSSVVMNWGGFRVFDLTNPPPFTWTNFQFNVTASRPSESIQLQFFNPPSFFGFDDFSVTPAVLLKNGGFETGTFSGWSQSGDTGNDSVINNIGAARVGAYVGRFGAANNPSHIGQAISTQPGQPYLVSLWRNNPSGATPNEYHASWNGQSLDDQTNVPAAAWTNLHYVALATSPQSSLQFGFRDDSDFLFMDDVSVIPVPIVQNGGFEFGDFTGWTQSGNTSFSGVNMSETNSGYYKAYFGPQNTLGFISQTFATVPGQSYLVGFSVDNPNAPSPNTEFRASWNGLVLMDTTNIGIQGWLPNEFIVPATSTNTTLEFGFRDDSHFLYLDDVFVSPVSAPAFQSISKGTNNVVNLSWGVLPGYLYELQYTTNFSQPNWKVLNGGFFFPTNLPMSMTDTNAVDSQRFYRVLMLPPPLIF